MDIETLKVLIICSGLIIITIVFIIFTHRKLNKKYIEHFNSGTQLDKYGNIIYYKDDFETKDKYILLPGRFRITGIDINDSDSNDTTTKYKLYIADNKDDIDNPDKRKIISCAENGGSVLTLGKPYTKAIAFEKDDNGLFVGQVLLIKPDDSYADIKENPEKLPEKLKITIYGVDPFAPSLNDYKKFTKITMADADIKVGYIKYTKLPEEDKDIELKYSNTIDNNNNKYKIDGPIGLKFTLKEGDEAMGQYIFLSNPIIVNKLYNGDTQIPNTDFELYGTKTVSTRDKANFKLQQQSYDEKHIIVGGEKCPNVGEMINKQLQAQQICEALEYKDKARNKKLAYEKDKIYLGKLSQQDKEIEELESIVKGLIERKNSRIVNNKGSNIDELEKELRRVEKVREDAETYLKSSGKNINNMDLKVKLNLDPRFSDISKNAIL